MPHQNKVVLKENSDCGSLSLQSRSTQTCQVLWMRHQPWAFGLQLLVPGRAEWICVLKLFLIISLVWIQLIQSPQASHCCLKTLFSLFGDHRSIEEIGAGNASTSETDRNQYCPVQSKVKLQLDQPQGFTLSLLLKCCSWLSYSPQQIESIFLFSWSQETNDRTITESKKTNSQSLHI